MQSLTRVAVGLALASSLSVASTSAIAKPMDSHAPEAAAIVVSCSSPKVSESDVHAIFGAQSRMNARVLGGALRRAVEAACEQNIARITVERRGSSLAWAAAPAESNVAVAAR